MGTGAVQTIKQSTDLVSQSLVNGVYILSQVQIQIYVEPCYLYILVQFRLAEPDL